MSAVLHPKKVLIPIREWAKMMFPAKTPHHNTLLRWVHEGRIHPKPERIGHSWHVQQHATYQTD